MKTMDVFLMEIAEEIINELNECKVKRNRRRQFLNNELPNLEKVIERYNSDILYSIDDLDDSIEWYEIDEMVEYQRNRIIITYGEIEDQRNLFLGSGGDYKTWYDRMIKMER